MEYYYQKYMDRPCNFQMNGCADKLAKRPNIPQCKESMERFEYISSFASKTYSILSYIVGGFVGSKSQMNNNKHDISYDLSAAIFNLLNPCKHEREKSSVRRTNENTFYTAASRINPDCYEKYIVNRSSQKSEKMKDCIVDVMELNWLGSMTLLDHSNYMLNVNNHPKGNLKEVFSDTWSCDKKTSLDSSKDIIENIPGVKVECIVKENLQTVREIKGTDKNLSHLDNVINPTVDVTDSELSKVFMCEVQVEDLDCGASVKESPRRSINFLAADRFRQFSECSVESTDSESFIVFDDPDQDEGCCLNYGNNDEYDSEDENEDEDSSCDDYDLNSVDKELAEANSKWLKNYKDVATEEDDEKRKVRFSDDVKVNKMIAWDFAYRAARPGPWEQMGRDRDRFRERILRLSHTISPVLRKEHRDKIFKELYS